MTKDEFYCSVRKSNLDLRGEVVRLLAFLRSRVRIPAVTRTRSSCEKSTSQRSAEGRGFSPGTSVSSHRES